jgi:predicted transposase/invertase (TIGR01784 family)
MDLVKPKPLWLFLKEKKDELNKKIMTERFINPFTDFGFKKIFGEEANKDLLIDFLNELFQDKGKIIDLNFLKNEHLGSTPEDRKAIFDLYCENEKGEKFIVELQKAKQQYFKDRSLYYATFPVQEQALRGDWNFELKAVYTVAIMDFVFDDDTDFLHDVRLTEQKTGKIFTEKLRFVYLEMPKFNKTLDELETHFEKWLYVLKNLVRLDKIPAKLQEKIFLKLFEVAEIANYSSREQTAYQDSIKYYRDWKNSLDTAILDGRNLAMTDVAASMKNEGEPVEKIMKFTGLSKEEIEKL